MKKITITSDSYIFQNIQSMSHFISYFSKDTIEMCTIFRFGQPVVFRILGQQLAAAGYSVQDFADFDFDIEEEPQADSIAHLNLQVGEQVTVFCNDSDGKHQHNYTIKEIFETGFCLDDDNFFFGGASRFYFHNGKFLSRSFMKLREQDKKMPGVWDWDLDENDEYAMPQSLQCA